MQSRIGSTTDLNTSARFAALDRHRLPSEPAPNENYDENYDRLTRLACRTLGTPISAISSIAEDRPIFISGLGLAKPWIGPRQSPLAYSFCQQVIYHGKPVAIEETRVDKILARHPAAREIGVVAYLGVPLVDADGHVHGAFCVVDFKARRWTDEQIEILNDLASLAMTQIQSWSDPNSPEDPSTRVRDEFVAIASHELRNPVAAIKATAQLLKRTLDRGRIEPERLSRYAAELDQTGHRLAVLVNDLLDVSRLRTGQLALDPEWIDPVAILESLLGQSTASHPLRLECVDGSCLIYADPVRLQQVLGKLLDNAVKYSPNGGAITVNVTRTTAQMLIQVKDSGIGLSAEDLSRIFEPFGRGGNAARRRLPGMGLGLYVCHQIIVAHGGALWAESPGEGEGTTMLVRLPLTGPPTARSVGNA